jgi:hypothetical protein
MPDQERSKLEKFAPFLIFAAISILYSYRYLLAWNYIGVGDWELFVTMADIPRRIILHYHQFPFWNPYIGGGNILFAHPEVGVLSPFFLIIMVFGAVGALKLQILIAYFLGFWGTFLLSRRLGLSGISSYLVSFAYFGSVYFGLHFAIGHIPFTHFCFLPWFIFFLLKTDDGGKYLIGAALAVFLLIIGNGAAVPFLYTAFFSGLFIILWSLNKRDFAYIKRYIAGLIGGVALAAIKFIPMTAYLMEYRWEGRQDDYTPLGLLWNSFLSLNQNLFQEVIPEQHWGWHEYGAYISPLIMVLALIDVIFIFRKIWIWLVLGIFFFLLGLGDFSDFSPWSLLLQIPGFSSLRGPSRMFQFVILSAAILAGFGLDFVIGRFKIKEKARKPASIVIVAIILATNFYISFPASRAIFHKRVEPARFNPEFKHIIGSKDNIYGQFQENCGSLVAPWLSGYRDSRAIITPTNTVLMEFVEKGEAKIIRRDYTPNRVEYLIEPLKPGMIVFGIGYDKGWAASDNRPVYEINGLAAVDFGLNDRNISLIYRTPLFGMGVIISIATFVLFLVLVFHGKIRKRFEAIFK